MTKNDQVHSRQRWVGLEIVPGEDAYTPNRPVDLISVTPFDEETAQSFRRNIADNALRVDAGPGAFNRFQIRVRDKDLDRDMFRPVFDKLKKGDGGGIGVLTRHTAGNPDA